MDRSKQLGDEGIGKLLLSFTIPAMIGMIVNSLYNVVDRIFIGHGVGSLGIAGITVGFPMMMAIMAFSMLIGIGTASLISIRLGEGKKAEAELIFANGTLLLILITSVISGLGLLFLDKLLALFGASPEVLPYSRDYMGIILFGTTLNSTAFGMNHMIRAEGSPKIAMFTMLIGAISNTIMDPIFIFVFGWGIKGAALATVLSRILTATWTISHFTRGNSLLRFQRQNFRLQPEIVRSIVAIGSAPFAMQLANSLINAILNKSLQVFGGDIAVAAMGIIMSASTLLLMPIMGINQGAQPVIGFNYGARQYDRVKKALLLAMAGATGIVVIGFIVTRVYPTALVSLFNPNDQELIAFGSRALSTYLLALPVIGFQVVGANYFQAVGKPKQAMLLTLSRQVILLIPLILILPRFWGVHGIFWAGPIADAVSACLTGFWLLREISKLTKSAEVCLELN